MKKPTRSINIYWHKPLKGYILRILYWKWHEISVIFHQSVAIGFLKIYFCIVLHNIILSKRGRVCIFFVVNFDKCVSRPIETIYAISYYKVFILFFFLEKLRDKRIRVLDGRKMDKLCTGTERYSVAGNTPLLRVIWYIYSGRCWLSLQFTVQYNNL